MLNVQDLRKSYQVGSATYEVLRGVCLRVEKGEFVAVMGPSGSGKTTLLNCISCYIPADSGSITLNGRELARLNREELARVRNRQLGFVFQDFLLLDGLTVRQNILLPAILSGAVTPPGPGAGRPAVRGFRDQLHPGQIPRRDLGRGKAAHRQWPGPSSITRC